MIIVHKKTLAVVSDAYFRSLHKHVCFPAVLSNAAIEDTEYTIIDDPELPALGKYETIVLGAPYLQNKKIKVDWTIQVDVPPVAVIVKEFESAIDDLINQTARSYKYDSAYTMISYFGDPNPKFDREARSMFAWRSAVWTKANQILTEFEGVTDLTGVDLPSIEEVLLSLPVFELLAE